MTGDRPKYQYIIRDPKTHELHDILTPHVKSCGGGPDTCGGCDACLLQQAECAGMEIERQPIKDDTAMRDGIFPWALDCDVCGRWEYAPGEMLEPDQNGHHPNCKHYEEPRGAKARLNSMVRANRAHRRLKARIKELEAYARTRAGKVATVECSACKATLYLDDGSVMDPIAGFCKKCGGVAIFKFCDMCDPDGRKFACAKTLK